MPAIAPYALQVVVATDVAEIVTSRARPINPGTHAAAHRPRGHTAAMREATSRTFFKEMYN